jgi:hypothetical protein
MEALDSSITARSSREPLLGRRVDSRRICSLFSQINKALMKGARRMYVYLSSWSVRSIRAVRGKRKATRAMIQRLKNQASADLRAVGLWLRLGQTLVFV